MSKNINNTQENTDQNKHKSFIDLAANIQIDISKLEASYGKFAPSNDETKCATEIVSLFSLFIKSLGLTICCCDILHSLDFESKFNVDYLEQVKTLHPTILKRIGRKP